MQSNFDVVCSNIFMFSVVYECIKYCCLIKQIEHSYVADSLYKEALLYCMCHGSASAVAIYTYNSTKKTIIDSWCTQNNESGFLLLTSTVCVKCFVKSCVEQVRFSRHLVNRLP